MFTKSSWPPVLPEEPIRRGRALLQDHLHFYIFDSRASFLSARSMVLWVLLRGSVVAKKKEPVGEVE